jgi:hypothetical protein
VYNFIKALFYNHLYHFKKNLNFSSVSAALTSSFFCNRQKKRSKKNACRVKPACRQASGSNRLTRRPPTSKSWSFPTKTLLLGKGSCVLAILVEFRIKYRKKAGLV